MRRSTKLLTACAALTADCNNPSFEAVDLASLTSLCPEGLESGEHGSCNGTYHGVITIEASRADGELTSTCTGEMVVTIDTSATPSIRGAGSCEFDGLLSSLGRVTAGGWGEGLGGSSHGVGDPSPPGGG